MRQWLSSHLTYANVISTLCLFLLLGGGTAVALNGSNTVFSDDITDNQVYSADVRNDTLAGGGLTAPDLRANSVGSSEVANASIASGDLAPAARSARAYGFVGPSSTLTNSKNVTSVTTPVAGIHCITFGGGIDPASVVLIVSAAGSQTNQADVDDFVVVSWFTPGAAACPAGTKTVVTYLYNGDSTDNNDGTGDLTGDNLDLSNEGFGFIVP